MLSFRGVDGSMELIEIDLQAMNDNGSVQSRSNRGADLQSCFGCFKSFDLESQSLHECILSPCLLFVLCGQKHSFDIHTGPACEIP